MPAKKRLIIIFLAVNIFFCSRYILAYPIFETEKLIFSGEGYLRFDSVNFNNVTDLDSANKADKRSYLGLDYSLSFKVQDKEDDSILFLKLERNGPYDYDAVLVALRKIDTTSGEIKRYRGSQLLPQAEEFWADFSPYPGIRVKCGLYTYEVGNGFSLNGGYENFGITLYGQSKNISWRIYYCRPDISYKNPLGPRIPQEKEEGIGYEHNAANFFAADLEYSGRRLNFRPYIGALADYTSSGKRDNIFAAPIKRDILATAGFACDFNFETLSIKTELAGNFGSARSSEAAYKDIRHSGYLAYAALGYTTGKFRPSLQVLLASGNKVSEEDALNPDGLLTGSRNRAFSCNSPMNKNLGDSISSSNVDMLTVVTMGGGYGLNYGLPRPKTFAAGDFENLLLPCLSFDWDMRENLCAGFYFYYLRAFQKGVGTFQGEPKYLSRQLGWEADMFVDYKISPNLMVSLLAGYFWPGEFYKENRDDTEGSLLTPYVRGDGRADNAYQVELVLESKF